jgi:hypothetical protein
MVLLLSAGAATSVSRHPNSGGLVSISGFPTEALAQRHTLHKPCTLPARGLALPESKFMEIFEAMSCAVLQVPLLFDFLCEFL